MKNVLFLIFVASFAACHPFDVPQQGDAVLNVEDKTLDQLVVPDAFTFNTQQTINLTVSMKNNNGQLMKNVPFKLFTINANSTDSVFLLSAVTNTEGVFTTPLELSTDVARVIAITDYIGVPSYQTAAVNSTNMAIRFGDENDLNKPRNLVTREPAVVQGRLSPDAVNFKYMGEYDANGVPRYLLPKGDIVNDELLEMINASLPEGEALPKSHPEYLKNTVQNNVVLREKAEVWVTFVHEGAGYQNALGYYSYPTNSPPKSADDIQNLTVLFPNASYAGSGGGLKSGDKVLLNVFEGGTTISWFVVPNGWNGRTQKVSDSQFPVHYSNNAFNTFTKPDYQQHVVTLFDRSREMLLVGCEDIDRPGGDNDFNDAIFYATVSPFQAVETKDMAETTPTKKDSDNDGVSDHDDDEPNNDAVSSYTYTPALNKANTLAFEDLWPLKGDYDMNDVVVDYNVQEKLNRNHKIKQIKLHLTLRAFGGSFRNGFGFELPIPASKIASVEGAKIKDSYLKFNANGTEAGNDKAVIIAFDNSYSLVSTNGSFMNTDKGVKTAPNYTFDLIVTFTNPITRAELGSAPYNPFIIVNRERGREVHLAGYKPTQLADKNLFKTGEDDSQGNKYYQTKQNLPWAIHVATSFQYPIEKAPINKAYLKFNNWAESGGTSFKDWFNNKTNYTNPLKIY
jgi:LruC domain-containing protein